MKHFPGFHAETNHLANLDTDMKFKHFQGFQPLVQILHYIFLIEKCK